MRDVLNPRLYQALTQRYGRVYVTNAGQSHYMVPDPKPDGSTHIRYKGGEFYRVDCPNCQDYRQRLYFSYMWGVQDDLGRHTDLMLCYHKNCFRDRNLREQLWLELYNFFDMPSVVSVRKGVETQNLPYTPPGSVSRLDRLSPTHPAVQYVVERGFDPHWLAEIYGVGYVEDAYYEFQQMQGRLFLPVTFRGHLRGWQGRWLDDNADWKKVPKYFNWYGFHKSEFLYGFDAAADYRVTVLVEGVTNVWRFGPQAVACFGSTVSSTQLNLLAETVGTDGALVLLFDGDTWLVDEGQTEAKATTALRNLLLRMPGRVIPVQLPVGADPAKYSTEEIRAIVSQALSSAGCPYRLSDPRGVLLPARRVVRLPSVSL